MELVVKAKPKKWKKHQIIRVFSPTPGLHAKQEWLTFDQ